VFIGYVSLDEVNQDLANELSVKFGATLEVFASPAEMSDWSCDAVVYDFDSLPGEQRERIYQELTRGRGDGVRVVHSYSLGSYEKKALRSRGVLVLRRLGPGLLRQLVFGRQENPLAQLVASA
jgi:hypothetical protein